MVDHSRRAEVPDASASSHDRDDNSPHLGEAIENAAVPSNEAKAAACDSDHRRGTGGCDHSHAPCGCDHSHAAADSDVPASAAHGCGRDDCGRDDCDGDDCDGDDCDGDDCDDDNCDDDDCDGEHSDDELDTTWFDEHAPAVDSPTPDEIVELVVACVNFVRDALGVELDFTPETLPVLDHYLMAARESVMDRIELRELVWRCAGAYFGELVRRRYNGFWHLPSADVHGWRLHQRRVMLSFNPVGMVAEAMAGSDQGEGPSGTLLLARPDQSEIARRLADVPPLPEDQFYLLSTRLEVIDIVVEHLRLLMDQNDQADIEFDADDYAGDLMPYGSA